MMDFPNEEDSEGYLSVYFWSRDFFIPIKKAFLMNPVNISIEGLGIPDANYPH